MDKQTRRCTLHMGMAALATGGSGPILPPAAAAAAASADTELIHLCGLWQAVDSEFGALCQTRDTLESDHQTQAENDRLLDHQLEIERALQACLPPKTAEGATAIAKLALDAVGKCDGNYRCLPDVCHQMAWDALQFFFRMDSRARRFDSDLHGVSGGPE